MKTAAEVNFALGKLIQEANENGLAVICMAVPCRPLPVGRDGRDVGTLQGFWTEVNSGLAVHTREEADRMKDGIMIEPDEDLV